MFGSLSMMSYSALPWQARIGLVGKSIESTSNIFFSNGLLDPWSAGGVLTNVSESLEAFVIPNG